jgi:alkylmercury lyase
MNCDPGEQFAKMSAFLKDNGLFPAGSKLSQSILLQLYRLLAKGQPVEVDFLAQSLGEETSTVNAALKQVPPSNIVYTQTGAISAYRGLDINKSRHRIIINNKTLYTWCAFDCLFLPELLRCEAEIFSTCPGSGHEVHFHLDCNGNTIPAPANLFISFVMPDVRDYEDDLRQKFCCHVNFFTNKKAGVDWTNNRANCALITIEEAIDLARIRNNTGFGKVLS